MCKNEYYQNVFYVANFSLNFHKIYFWIADSGLVIGAFGVYRVIGHVCLSVCLSVCLAVCLSVYTITKQIINGSIHLKLEPIVVYENSSDEFDNVHCPIKVSA